MNLEKCNTKTQRNEDTKDNKISLCLSVFVPLCLIQLNFERSKRDEYA